MGKAGHRSTFRRWRRSAIYNRSLTGSRSSRAPAFARVLAGLIDATRFMAIPKNADGSRASLPHGRTVQVSKQALRISTNQVLALEDDGLWQGQPRPRHRRRKDVAESSGEEAVAYERLVDRACGRTRRRC